MKYTETIPHFPKERNTTMYNEEFFEIFSLRDFGTWDTETGLILVYEDEPYMKEIKVQSGISDKKISWFD